VKASGVSSALTAVAESQLLADQCIFSDTSGTAVVVKGSAVAKLTQCLFRDIYCGAVSSTDDSQLYVDSCQVLDCHIEITNTRTVNVVTGTTLERKGANGISWSGATTAHLAGNIVAGS
jgi:hypothetical protein